METTPGKRVQMVREAKGYKSITAFAEFTSLKVGTLSALEADKSAPSLETLARLNAAFPDVSMEWLISGTGTMLRNGQALASVAHGRTHGEARAAVEAVEPTNVLRRNREGEGPSYWEQIAIERQSTIELLKKLLSQQFPALSEDLGKLMHGEYAAVAMPEPVGFRQAARYPLMFVAKTGHRLEWINAVAQSLTVAPAALKKTA